MEDLLRDLMRNGVIDALRDLDGTDIQILVGGLAGMAIALRLLGAVVFRLRRRRIYLLGETRAELRARIQRLRDATRAREATRLCDFCIQEMGQKALVCGTCHRPNLDRLDAFITAEYDRRVRA